MATRTCILLLAGIGVAAAIHAVMPKVDPPSDSIFASHAAQIRKLMEKLNLMDAMTHVKYNYGDMVRLTGTGFWNLEKALEVYTKNASKNMPEKIKNEIEYLKEKAKGAGLTVTKRSVRFPMDFGDQKLVFLVNDIIVPDGQ